MAEEKKEKEAEKAADPKAPAGAKKGGKLMLIVLPVVGALAGIGATFAVPKPTPQGDHKPQEPPEEIGEFAIPDLKANLHRAGGLHFCMVDLLVNFKSRKMKEVKEHLGLKVEAGGGGGHGGGGGAAPKPAEALMGSLSVAVRDRIILLLSSKSIEDLEGREKKELLKKEIQQEIEPLLFPHGDGKIEAVLFKDLLIQ